MSSRSPPAISGGVQKPKAKPPSRKPKVPTVVGVQSLPSYSDSSEDDAAARPRPVSSLPPGPSTGGAEPGRAAAQPSPSIRSGRHGRSAAQSPLPVGSVSHGRSAAQTTSATGGAGPGQAVAQLDMDSCGDTLFLCDAVPGPNLNRWVFPTDRLPDWAAPIPRNQVQVAEIPPRPPPPPGARAFTARIDQDVLWCVWPGLPQSSHGGHPHAPRIVQRHPLNGLRGLTEEAKKLKWKGVLGATQKIRQIRSSAAPYSVYTSTNDRLIVEAIEDADKMLKIMDGPVLYFNPSRVGFDPFYMAYLNIYRALCAC